MEKIKKWLYRKILLGRLNNVFLFFVTSFFVMINKSNIYIRTMGAGRKKIILIVLKF